MPAIFFHLQEFRPSLWILFILCHLCQSISIPQGKSYQSIRNKIHRKKFTQTDLEKQGRFGPAMKQF